MQVFVIGSPLDTAYSLDKRRLNKQIIECGQILSALNGESDAWKNHPCTKQYRGHENWLRLYRSVLMNYGKDISKARKLNGKALECTPTFHKSEYFDQMKRRLYTKDKEHYACFSEFGESDVNWYWNEDIQEYVKYKNGRLFRVT